MKEPWYDQIEKWIIIVFSAIIIALTFFTVCSRFIFAYTLPWSEQLDRLLMIYMFFAGMSWAGRLDLHYKVTALTMLFKKNPKITNGLLLFGDIVMVLFGFYMSYRIGQVMVQMMKAGPTLASMPWCPKWIQYLAGVLGMAGMSVRIIQRLVLARREKQGGAEEMAGGAEA